jgi:hypothetical protein
MRDLVAGIVALALLVVAVSLATTLTWYRRLRKRAVDSERALGRTIIAELPTDDDLVLFSEDRSRFYYGDQAIDKAAIAAVRMLINGVPIAAAMSPRHARETSAAGTAERDRGRNPGLVNDQPEGILRDRWDVVIETIGDTVLVRCGAIRERVSQELARAVFDAVKRSVEA